jgi:hypothetical protein
MIGFIDTFFTITINYNSSNQWLSKTRSIPYWTTNVFSSAVTDLGPHLRIGHFFSLRCPLVNTSQLNTPLLNCILNSLVTELNSRINYMSPFYNLGVSRIEITTSNISSVTACLFVAMETWLATCYPGTTVLPLLRAQPRKCVYRTAA